MVMPMVSTESINYYYTTTDMKTPAIYQTSLARRDVDLSPPVIYYYPFQGGISAVFLYCLFLVSVSMAFHLIYVQIVFSSV